MTGNVRFVGDEDDSVAALIEILEKRHDFFAGLRIKVPGRLISKDNGRIVNQGPGNGDALALSAGQVR